MRSSIALLLGAAAVSSAIEFTSPGANTTVTRGDGQRKVSWSTVDTDPEVFSIYLVNFVNWPPYYQQLAANVNTASGVTEVRIPCGIDASSGYQLNAINGTNVYVIYAQTPKFTVGGAACEDPAPGPSTCAAPPAVTVTQTLTVTVSPSSFVHPSSSRNGTAAAVVAAATTSAAASIAVRVPAVGTCPDTIGWGNAGYGSPVTLPVVPHAVAAATVASAPLSSTTPAPEKVEYRTEGNKVYKTVYMDLNEYNASGSCACNA